MGDVLTIDSVIIAFREKKVLSNIFMRFETGSITGIFGRNGTGKSTLMKIIFGTLELEEKSIRINEKRIQTPYKEEGIMGYLPQDDFVPGHIKLKTALNIYEIDPEELISDFPVFNGLMNEKMKNLSGGEHRLAECYMILKKKAKFVLLDEPFSYLAPLQVQKLKEIMKLEKSNKGIIITDHMYKDVQEVSDTMYLLHQGKSHSITNENQLIEFGYINRK
ncbi:MAG TPA: ATP-binding cassette domain-containing protein [Bacteroidia bacterium]|jgi:ABC-type multidrug transport system ATPase subunit|nr:ATP-binding cassette domain-containing protein [Bacteroidia bacterium]